MNKIVFTGIVLLILSASCTKDYEYELSKSIFIEDPYAPGLPIYSEWGYNTFGAYFDRVPFVSTEEVQPAKILVNNDTIQFILQGEKDLKTTSVKFSFKGYSPQTEFDLTSLNGVTINLKDTTSKVELIVESTTYH